MHRHILVLLLATGCSRPPKPTALDVAKPAPASPPEQVGDAGPPPPSPPEPGTSLTTQARRCLEDVTCSASEAARLFLAGDDAREQDADCFRFLDGAAVPRDAARGRACLERMATAPCDGSSAFLGLAELATLRIDGVGGRVDVPGARALIASCYDDVTKEAILEHAAAKERDPKAPAVDFCTRGGTTVVWEECVGRRLENERTRGLIASKSVAPSLGADGIRKLLAANKAWSQYVRARVLYVFAVFDGGSLRTGLATTEQAALEKKRADDLAVFARFEAKSLTDDDVTRAARATNAAFTTITPSSPAEKRELLNTDFTWKAYRDAELAFYDHVYGADQGHDDVRRTLLVRLYERRAAECEPPPM